MANSFQKVHTGGLIAEKWVSTNMPDRLLEFLDSLFQGNDGAENGNCVQLAAPENISTIKKHRHFRESGNPLMLAESEIKG